VPLQRYLVAETIHPYIETPDGLEANLGLQSEKQPLFK
jgi:hypothetical protein